CVFFTFTMVPLIGNSFHSREELIMKIKLLTIFAAIMLCGTTAMASEQVFENANGEHVVAEAPTAKDIRAALRAGSESPDQHGRVWHCTAYADGHGHSWGFDYFDVHYNHAYYGAVQRC